MAGAVYSGSAKYWQCWRDLRLTVQFRSTRPDVQIGALLLNEEVVMGDTVGWVLKRAWAFFVGRGMDVGGG